MIEKPIERLAAVFRIHGRIDQFAKDLDARVGFRRVFFFELFDVASAINQELQKFCSVRGGARSAEPFDGRPRGITLRSRTRRLNFFSASKIKGGGIEFSRVVEVWLMSGELLAVTPQRRRRRLSPHALYLR